MKSVLLALCTLLALQVFGVRCFAGERAEPVPEGVATLLHQLTEICGDRWQICFSDDSKIFISSTKKVLGKAAGYNFPIWEANYQLTIRFKVVPHHTAEEFRKFRSQLKAARKAASSVRHEHFPGGYSYYPESKEDWSRVVDVRRAEGMVRDLPEYSAGGVFLSEEYSMGFFIPNASSEDAKQLKRDMDAIYNLLTEVAEKD